MGSQLAATSEQGRIKDHLQGSRMSTRYQRQHMLEGGKSSYSREVRSASCAPPSDRTWLYSPSNNRSSYLGSIQTKSSMDLSNMYRYHSSEPVRYSVHQRFRSRFL